VSIALRTSIAAPASPVLISQPSEQLTQWATPEPGLWIATRRGEYAGMLEERDGKVLAVSATGALVGTFDNVADAQRILMPEMFTHSKQFRPDMRLAGAAVTSGVAAVMMAIAAFVVIVGLP
jgi:hypothetical protein